MLLGCKVTGVVPSRLFSPLTGRTTTKGTLCRMESFCCKDSLNGISADAFEDYTVDRTHAWIMFANNDDYQFELPSGLFDFLKDGMEFSAINMFFGTSFSGLPTDILYQISSVTDARGMFSSNQFLKSEIQVPTYNTYEDIKPFLGVLAYCVNISNIEDVPAELGGFGSRLFPQYHVGQICLDDGTFVEIKDYVYDENNLPIGFCYYSDDNVNKIASFSQSLLQWTTQLHINELYNAPLSTMLDGNYTPYWDAVYLNEDGEETTDIWLNWSGYTEHKDWYEALQACENYNFGTKNRKTYIPAISEVCDMYALCGWFNYARDIVIDRSNGVYTKQNCVGYQLSTSYSSCNNSNNNGVTRLVYMQGGTGKIFYYTCSDSMYFKFCTNIPQS